MPQTRHCAFQLHLALHDTGFFLIKLTTVLAHAPHSRTEPAKILSVPPDNKPTLAHSALLSWLGCHLPRHSGDLGARDFWFAGSRFLSFPSLQIWGKFPNLIIGYSYILLFPSSTQPTPVFLDTTSGLRFTFERGLGPGYLPLLPFPARGRLGGPPRPFPHC